MNFTEKLKRASADLNKSKAGERVGLKADTISSYITKKAIPRLDTAVKIARALSVPLEWLADDSQDWPPPQPSPALPAVLDDPARLADLLDLLGVAMNLAARQLRQSPGQAKAKRGGK